MSTNPFVRQDVADGLERLAKSRPEFASRCALLAEWFRSLPVPPDLTWVISTRGVWRWTTNNGATWTMVGPGGES